MRNKTLRYSIRMSAKEQFWNNVHNPCWNDFLKCFGGYSDSSVNSTLCFPVWNCVDNFIHDNLRSQLALKDLDKHTA